jgi:hypothetical protein
MLVFLMAVGPGEAPLAIDTLFHGLRLYPNSMALVRDDATTDGAYEMLQEFANSNSQRVILERNGQANGYSGIAVTIFQAFQSLSIRLPEASLVVRVDPDCCILRSGLVELAQRKFLEAGPGLLGCYKLTPEGEQRDHSYHRASMIRDLGFFGRDAVTNQVRIGFPFYLGYFLRALTNGYRAGDHVLASLVVLHGDTFRALARAGYWQSIPVDGSCHIKVDDPLISLGVASIGHKLIDINTPEKGEINVWVKYKGAIQPTAQEIVRRGYLAVHPLKGDESGRRLRNDLRNLLSKEERLGN